ncbi:ROK family protein, partial [Candidatus Saccharibacteria bacterium]|nr:ROK family protein [Candidatus Saccharibacteria bacterium]
NVPLQADLEAKLGSPVRIENDANLAGLGEYYALNEHPHQCLYLTVSTGIGGGVVTDGRLDPEHLDSEPGEMLIEHNGQLVMFEKLASGSAIVRDYGKRASDLNDPASWHEICAILAHGIINILSMFKPNYIIIGGGVGTHFSKYKDILGEELKKIKPPLVDIPRIVQASRPEEAVILGAWQLAKQLDGEA